MKLNEINNLAPTWNLTSTIDWCEPNYVSSGIVAELWNTWSNLSYIILSVVYIYSTHHFSKKSGLGGNATLYRNWVEGLGFSFVGIGSFLFHMTLMREFQALDELAMYFTILAHLYFLGNLKDEIEAKKHHSLAFLRLGGLFPSVRAAISAYALIAVFIGSCIAYEFLSPVVFQTSFGLSVLLGIYLSVSECLRSYKVHEKHQEYMHQVRRNEITLVALVVICSGVGFVAWRIDNLFCPYYEHFKLHSIWHFFTSYATYVWGVFAIYCYFTSRFGRVFSNQNHETEAVKAKIR